MMIVRHCHSGRVPLLHPQVFVYLALAILPQLNQHKAWIVAK